MFVRRIFGANTTIVACPVRFFLILRAKLQKIFGDYKIKSYLCIANEKSLAIRYRDVAQLVAHTSGGREVASSSLVIPTKEKRSRNASLFCCLGQGGQKVG